MDRPWPSVALRLQNLRECVLANNTLHHSASHNPLDDLGVHAGTIIENNPGSIAQPRAVPSPEFICSLEPSTRSNSGLRNFANASLQTTPCTTAPVASRSTISPATPPRSSRTTRDRSPIRVPEDPKDVYGRRHHTFTSSQGRRREPALLFAVARRAAGGPAKPPAPRKSGDTIPISYLTIRVCRSRWF